MIAEVIFEICIYRRNETHVFVVSYCAVQVKTKAKEKKEER